MSSATKLVFFLVFWFLIISITCGDGEPAAQAGNYNDGMSPPVVGGCGNCTICPYTCNTPPPPALGGGYPSYGTPPPPPQQGQGGQAYCPPAAPVQCCGGQQQYSPPSPFYYPYGNDSGSSATQLQPLIKPFSSIWCLAVFFVSVISLDLQL